MKVVFRDTHLLNAKQTGFKVYNQMILSDNEQMPQVQMQTFDVHLKVNPYHWLVTVRIEDLVNTKDLSTLQGIVGNGVGEWSMSCVIKCGAV